MPLIVEFTYEDGSSEIDRIPAEIWRQNEEQVTKVFVKEKKVTGVTLDPYRETADTDEEDNYYPRKTIPNRFQLYKQNRGSRGQSGSNPMQKKENKKYLENNSRR
jgi:hypothetical protein